MSERIIIWASFVIGTLLSLIGGLLVFAYIFEAWINRIGEVDQSLLFWYLPLLLIGLVALISGVTLGIFAFKKRKHLND